MAGNLCIQIHERDNVAIAIRDLPRGTEVMPGVVTAQEIPQAHKIALRALPRGAEVYRYGVCLGTVDRDIPAGGWINETNLVLAPAPDLDEMEFAKRIVTDLPVPARKTWLGYRSVWPVPGGPGQAAEAARVSSGADVRRPRKEVLRQAFAEAPGDDRADAARPWREASGRASAEPPGDDRADAARPWREASGQASAEPLIFGGTRNILAINTTVQCVTGVLNAALGRIREEILPNYPHVDDVIAINHPYGCGVAIDAPEAGIPQRILRNIAVHPNFGGQFMLVSLGCEKFTVDRFCEWWPELNTPENVIVLQEHRGYEAMIRAIMQMAERKLRILNERRREELPLSALLVGMQCGGSDAFSGITANPTAGYAADLLVAGGATVLFSEVTEVRDGVQYIAERCIDEEVGRRLVEEMRWYDGYLQAGGVNRSANTTPGNKKGGLSNIIEKSMGSIAKSGSSPIVEVLSPGQKPTKRGEIFAATPASDLVCGPAQLASGIGLQVFMTGRGTPYGLAAAPVIKVCSRSEMKDQWPDIIDFNAGPAAVGDRTIRDQGEELFDYILDVASGIRRPFTEQHGIANDLCIFNPAPIT